MNLEEKAPKQFKGEQFKTILLLYISKFDTPKKAQTLSNFERMLGYSIGRPDTRKLFSYLILKDALKAAEEKYFNFSLYYINKTALWEIIKNQKTYELCIKCFKFNIP